MLLNGSVAVVTGAGSGIGREIAVRMGAEGADVVLAGRSTNEMEQAAEEIRSTNRRALVIPMDLRDAASIEAAAQEVLREFGRVDVLVNNSGVSGPSKALSDMDKEEWDDTFAVNVTGTFLCCKAFLSSMTTAQSGSIIIIGSVTGKRPQVNRAPYAASKMALVGLVRTLALEAGPSQIRVNLVSPGGVEGERLNWALEQQAVTQGTSQEEARRGFTESSALKRLVTARDIAETTVFLASSRAASITGEDINVAGGLVMY